jgi:hypothetical protein
MHVIITVVTVLYIVIKFLFKAAYAPPKRHR